MNLYSIILSLRVLTRFKAHTAINIASLALGLTCALTILRYVHQELTVDSHFVDLENTYLMLQENDRQSQVDLCSDYNPNKETDWVYPSREPEVETVAEFCMLFQQTIKVEEQEFSLYGMATDSVFFDIANFPLIAGTYSLPAACGGTVCPSIRKR